MNVNFLPSPKYSAEKARMVSPLELAYLGDTVYDLLVRTELIAKGGRVKDLHRQAVSKVNACAQAEALNKILSSLSEDEAAIYRRGRNAHAHHQAPKAASVFAYASATGFEALLGYLYLIGDFDRLNALYDFISREEQAPCQEQP